MCRLPRNSEVHWAFLSLTSEPNGWFERRHGVPRKCETFGWTRPVVVRSE